MAASVQVSRFSGHNKTIRSLRALTSKSLPILLVAICFVLIANGEFDRVGGANADMIIGKGKNYDSTRLTELLTDIVFVATPQINVAKPGPAQDGRGVQKFHPNGRYGRRSIGGFGETQMSHIELATDSKLRGSNANGHPRVASSDNEIDLASSRLADQLDAVSSLVGNSGISNYQAELGKLLRCTFSGVSNLYYCNNASD